MMNRYASLALFALGFALLTGCGKAGSKSAPPITPTVSIAQPIPRKVNEWDEFTGRLASPEAVEVRARVSGYIDKIHFKEGGDVKQGDLLVTIDQRPYQAAVDRLTVQLGVTRSDIDARGYVGLLGQTVLALRALRQDSNKPLPPYLKPLLGGMSNLRGFASGTAAGDTLLALSAEAIVPLTSPLDVGKMGVSVFTDAGTTYDKGARLTDQTLKRGYGGSLWFAAAFLRLNIAVAHGRGSTTRVHVGGTVTF